MCESNHHVWGRSVPRDLTPVCRRSHLFSFHFSARLLCLARPMTLCGVCPSVTFVYSVETKKYPQTFSTSGSIAILFFFRTKFYAKNSDEVPLTRSSNPGMV